MCIQSNQIDISTSLVGRIKFKNDEDQNSAGTGFLVDKDIVITAYHNVKYYDELNKDWKIKFNINNTIETCSILEIIKGNMEIDIAIIRIDKSFEQDLYFEMIDFPIINDFRTLIEDIDVNILGYRAGRNEQNKFSAVINSYNQDGTVIVHFTRGMNEESKGLSGSPLIIKGKLYVYGINIEQYDPIVGLHVKSIINYSDCVRKFFDGTPVKIKKFDSYQLIEKEEYKISLLKEVENYIELRYIQNPRVKLRIIRESGVIIDLLRNMNSEDFEKLVNLISLHEHQNGTNKFIIDSNYQRYISSISEIICHMSVLACAYIDKELNLEAFKPIKITNNKYLSYMYSLQNSSYMASILLLFKYIEENPECDLNGISHILLGSDKCDEDCSGCKVPFGGAKIDFDSVVSNLCYTQGYEEDEKGRLRITNIEEDLQQLNFHCKKCLNFDTQADINSIKSNIKNILGE